MNIDPKRLYSRREVADLGFRSFSALAADASHGTGIPFYKFGKSVRYLGQDILDFVESCRADLQVSEGDA